MARGFLVAHAQDPPFLHAGSAVGFSVADAGGCAGCRSKWRVGRNADLRIDTLSVGREREHAESEFGAPTSMPPRAASSTRLPATSRSLLSARVPPAETRCAPPCQNVFARP